ncbi:MAG TPA: tetratricopeptide repeat protein [Ottowia sp.]|uniref:tetratricopeptide repeat protein n=1 Tax=Ottowia sp. TaxID=1898956 RepID=UPI002B9D83DF|nr:tetratricopeptide repeat protein [Ottowia sp.]HMN20092.1 tetratricopeptide repeat protein [Ottowia sp.]
MTARPAHFRHPLALLLALLALLALPAWADDYAEVQRLHAAGQTGEALAQADRYIGEHPRDPQMRFIKANLLSASGQPQAAEQMLEQLTRDYPELAEPWNNLAVLRAARGELAAARAALENALRIQPDYATALENLGDVQAREALRSYQRARTLDAGNPRLAPKIEALGSLLKARAGAGG